MTLETQVANVVWTAASIGLLWAVGRWFLLPTIRDMMRQKLFRIRRDMFLFMASGGISPEHPAYGYVRSVMNLAIRYADDISLSRAMIGAVAAGEFGRESIRAAEAAMASLPKETRTSMETFRRRAAAVIGIHAVVRSPVGWALVVGLVPFAIVAVVAVLFLSAWTKTWSGAMRIVTRKAEQETQILRCIEEEGRVAA